MASNPVSYTHLQAVHDRLDEAEREAERLRTNLDNARKLLSAPVVLPVNEWIQQQLGDLATVIREGGYEASLLLRQIVGRIEADQVIPPGKSRGYSRLRFRLHSWETLKAILATETSSDALSALLENHSDGQPQEGFVIDLGGPTLMDQWAPRIAEMRAAGTKWKEIVEVTGLDLNRAYRAWKRFVAAQSPGDVAEDNSISDTLDDSQHGSNDADEAA